MVLSTKTRIHHSCYHKISVGSLEVTQRFLIIIGSARSRMFLRRLFLSSSTAGWFELFDIFERFRIKKNRNWFSRHWFSLRQYEFRTNLFPELSSEGFRTTLIRCSLSRVPWVQEEQSNAEIELKADGTPCPSGAFAPFQQPSIPSSSAWGRSDPLRTQPSASWHGNLRVPPRLCEDSTSVDHRPEKQTVLMSASWTHASIIGSDGVRGCCGILPDSFPELLELGESHRGWFPAIIAITFVPAVRTLLKWRFVFDDMRGNVVYSLPDSIIKCFVTSWEFFLQHIPIDVMLCSICVQIHHTAPQSTACISKLWVGSTRMSTARMSESFTSSI